MPLVLALAGLALIVYALAEGGALASLPSPESPDLFPVPVPNIPFGPIMITDPEKAALALVTQYANGWDAADLMAFINIESSFDPRAFLADRDGGSYGLMQVTLPAAQQVGYAGDGPGLFDPATNVQVGVAYLDWINAYLTARLTSVSSAEVVAAYNAGVGAVARGYQDVAYVGRWQAARVQWAAILQQGVA